MMSDSIIREIGFDGSVKGEAVSLPAYQKPLSYNGYGDVDGYFGFPDAKDVVPQNQTPINFGDHVRDMRQSLSAARDKLAEWSNAVRGAVFTLVPDRLPTVRDMDRLAACVRGSPGVLAGRLHNLRECAQGRLVSWQSAVARRMSGWREVALTQQEAWLVLVEDVWTLWMRNARLRWMVLRSYLLERLMELGGLVRRSGDAGWLRYVFYVIGALRNCCSRLREHVYNFRQVLAFVRSAFRLSESNRTGRCWSPRLPNFPFFDLTGEEAMASMYQECGISDKSGWIGDELYFLWSEPQVKALVVALLFAFAVLAEVLAASFLPALCPSSTTPELSVHNMMASATLSASVLSSLKGAAASV